MDAAHMYGMTFYDPEAIYQDADIEMAEAEMVSARIHQLREQGMCTHQSAVGYLSTPIYPEQDGLRPGQLRCTDGCGEVFDSDADWDNARAATLHV